MTIEVQWSELQRDPKSVAALADAGDVRIRRRDGAPLLLIREDRAESAETGALTAARALRNVLMQMPVDRAGELLRDEFPWVELLPPADPAAFVKDFVRAVQACAELHEWSTLAQTITEWKATAIVHSDPALLELLTTDTHADLGPVPHPHHR